MWNLMKTISMGIEFFHTNGRTDMKLIVAFRNFSNEPKKSAFIRLRKHSAIRCSSCRVYGSLCTKFDHVNAPHNDAVMNLSQRTCGWNTNKCKAHFNGSFFCSSMACHITLSLVSYYKKLLWLLWTWLYGQNLFITQHSLHESHILAFMWLCLMINFL
jgi:hypothetical protein